MQPKISIIIPVYNAEKYIRRCLDSCIHQTLKEIEIIVVDDCGNDDSIKIAQEYASKDLRITILYHIQNSGSFQARKTGIEYAKGLYCMFCDSDDFLDTQACENALNIITVKKVDILALKMQHFPKTFKRINPYIYKGRFRNNQMRQIFAKSRDAESLGNKIISTQVLKSACKTLDFVKNPLLFSEDGLLLLVASFYAQSYYGQDNIIYYYCDNEQSITRQNTIKNLYRKYIDLEYILDILEELKIIFPNYADFIKSYGNKTASMLIIQARFFKKEHFYQAHRILSKYNFSKKTLPASIYIKSVFLSLRYHFRWQNLIRLITYLISFGKIKI